MVEKSVIVTGSIKGIGLEIAKRFLEEGYFVIFNYATDYQTAKEFLDAWNDAAQRLTEKEKKQEEEVSIH